MCVLSIVITISSNDDLFDHIEQSDLNDFINDVRAITRKVEQENTASFVCFP
jgi:hypothetical protein